MFHSHLGTCSRLAGKKHHVHTLESEKIYSFRCVFSFSVSRTITNLFGTFWDLMSCKTEHSLGVTSCSHWNKGPTKMNRTLLKGLVFPWSFLSVQFAFQTCILKLLNPVPNRNRFGLKWTGPSKLFCLELFSIPSLPVWNEAFTLCRQSPCILSQPTCVPSPSLKEDVRLHLVVKVIPPS